MFVSGARILKTPKAAVSRTIYGILHIQALSLYLLVGSAYMPTMDDSLDDDYVANLLKEDATKTNQNASVIGMRAYMPQRYVA